jgi:hypothetical protein
MGLPLHALWKIGLWIEVNGLHIVRDNCVEELPAVDLIEVVKSITAERDHQLLHSIVVYIHHCHLPRNNRVPLLPAASSIPIQEPISHPIITGNPKDLPKPYNGGGVVLWKFNRSIEVVSFKPNGFLYNSVISEIRGPLRLAPFKDT